MVDVQIEFDARPFQGLAPAEVIDDIIRDCERELSNAVLERVHFFLDQSIRHPTPYYETQIIQETIAGGEVVHDRGIVYGPWLEGTSERNNTTRFRGYHSFRRARQAVDDAAPAIVQRIVVANLSRL